MFMRVNSKCAHQVRPPSRRMSDGRTSVTPCRLRPADLMLWTPALDRHIEIFGRAPDVAADRGVSSVENEDGGASPIGLDNHRRRRAHERQRERVGCEGPDSLYPCVASRRAYSALRASLGSTPAALRAGT